ncbi:MAG: polysaccharide biosynthesis protein [Muribaculaceae bacterium]|nr:polysaccharide biosynthesis protein [Muribaculaceae bacterium]
MKKNLLTELSQSRIVKKLAATPSPRWLVLAVDMLIVLFSCVLTYYFNQDIEKNSFWYDSGVKIGIFIATYLLFSFVYRSFMYIVRLSVIGDMYRIAMLCGTSSIFLWIVSEAICLVNGSYYMRPWNVLIVGVFSFSLMMVVRLILKYLYGKVTQVGNARKPVIVLGSAINSFVLAQALRNEADGRYEPVALLSLVDKKIDTTVNGIPIIKYDENNVKQIFEKYECDTLLFLSTQIELMRNGFADIFLDNNIKLLMLNQVEEFDTDSQNEPSISGHVSNINIENLLGRDTIKNDNPDISRQLHGQVVMITGAAGSIGSEIVRQVAKCGAKEIVLFDQAETPMHEIQLEMEEKHPDVKLHLFIADITNRQRVERAFTKYHPRFVFHAAAYKHVPMMERNPAEAVLNNVFGTKNLADVAVEFNVEKFVMISTDKAVNPTNIMGATKRIAEIYVQSLFFHNQKQSNGPTTSFITTRFGNVLGSNGSVIPLFRRQIEQGGPVTVTHRDIIRYFMTIPEACSLVLEAGCMGNGGEIYIFDMGKPVKIYDLATRMISLAGLVPGKDIEIVETGLRPGEKLFEELLNDKEKTRATRHHKIMIAQVQVYEMENINKQIDRLYQLARTGQTHDMVACMKTIVPEFISQNSKFHDIDIELNHTN